MKSRTSVTVIFAFLLTAGCSVTGDTEEVRVTHTANQEIVGKWAAETFCAKQGKIPKILRVSPTVTDISTLYFRTKTSVYTCVGTLPQ